MDQQNIKFAFSNRCTQSLEACHWKHWFQNCLNVKDPTFRSRVTFFHTNYTYFFVKQLQKARKHFFSNFVLKCVKVSGADRFFQTSTLHDVWHLLTFILLSLKCVIIKNYFSTSSYYIVWLSLLTPICKIGQVRPTNHPFLTRLLHSIYIQARRVHLYTCTKIWNIYKV